jgi:hypothetical protein
MTDLTDLLDSAAGNHPAPSPDVVHEDVARGRRALVRRRWTRAGLAVTGAAAVAVAAVAVPAALDTGPDVRGVVPAAGGGVGPAADAPNPGVDLVPFDAGPSPKPLSPGLVPDGWSVSGDEHALVIAPPGSDTSPADYRGKLVVYLDANTIPNESLPMKVSVDVGDRTGFAIRAEPAMLQVWVPQEDGTALRAQAPPSLGWDEATLGRFLGEVVVGEGASAGVG